MQKLSILKSCAWIFFFLLFAACEGDKVGASGSFSYTLTGAASQTISGEETNFGLNNGKAFITLTMDTDVMTLEILTDPIETGTFLINPILVNGNAQTIMDRDAFAELGIGSSANGNRRSFSSNAADGGSITLSSVKDNELKGTFNISMQELLGGGTTQPTINATGSFTAVKK